MQPNAGVGGADEDDGDDETVEIVAQLTKRFVRTGKTEKL